MIRLRPLMSIAALLVMASAKADDAIDHANFELLASEAQRRGYAQDSRVQAEFTEYMVQAYLKSEVDKLPDPSAVPQHDVDDYFRRNRSRYDRPATVRAHHILVASHAEAEQIIADIKAADLGAFITLARKKSLDTETKLRGGDLQYFTATGKSLASGPQVDEHIVRAAFALNHVGDVSAKPVQVGKFWSVIKLTGRRHAYSASLGNVEKDIRQHLWIEQRRKALETHIASLQAKYKPHVAPNHLDSIVFK